MTFGAYAAMVMGEGASWGWRDPSRLMHVLHAGSCAMALSQRRLEGEDSSPRYWAFAADPGRYRIRDAVADLTTDWWTTKDKPIRAGDKAMIWQTRDRLSPLAKSWQVHSPAQMRVTPIG
jgi:hypothetical protein